MTKRLNRRNAVVIEGAEHKVVLNDGFSKCEECSLNYLCDDYANDSEFNGCVPCATYRHVLGDVYFKKGNE